MTKTDCRTRQLRMRRLPFKPCTVSGDVRLTGGGGEVDITTVSGSSTLELADVTRARFKSVSGDLAAELALAPDGQLESESVSGEFSFKFATVPAAEFDVQSFSGDIKLCAKGLGSSHTSALSLAQVSRPPMVVPYVY